MSELSCLPYSVGYEDEGVCLSIQIGPYSILLDCGLHDITALREEAADFVFCSHAHTDHMRGLLPLHRAFPHLPIFGSDVTARLLPLNWPGQADAQFCRSLPWRSSVELAPGLSVQLWPAGHLPGAACFFITYQTAERTYSVFYTGDCFLSNGRLVDGLPLSELRNLKPDLLIIEGSYGTERHPHRKQQENYLVDRLGEALLNCGRAVFPTPLLGLGQELLMLVRAHHHFTGQPIDVWVDPMIGWGCDAYLGSISTLPAPIQNFAQHQPLFWDERVLPRVRRLGLETTAPDLASGADPAIFIVHPSTHPSRYCQDDPANWTVFAPSLADIDLWQAQLPSEPSVFAQLSPTSPTAQRPMLRDTSIQRSSFTRDNAPVKVPSQSVSSQLGTASVSAQGREPLMTSLEQVARSSAEQSPFNWLVEMQAATAAGTAAVEHYMLTNHCDGGGTTQLIHNLRPQHVMFVHGDVHQLSDLASLDDLQSRYQLHLPTPGQVIEFPLAEAFWQPAPPQNDSYEGEVDTSADRVMVTLPNNLEADPRWRQLSDTGIVEASWQGDQLIIRGVNQQELMQVKPRDALAQAQTQTCYYCRHLRGQRCRNPESPLVGLQVTSDGTCSVFERSSRALG
ncbi:MAG: MBL fold metallo-hydrolase [Cyanobacteria bacterium J06598_3]